LLVRSFPLGHYEQQGPNNNMRNKQIEEQSHRLKLTVRQREILIGTLLGDGHLETQNQGKTYRLKIEHSVKQRAYVNWFYQAFQEWVRTPPRARVRTVTFRGVSKEYERIGFATLSTGSLRFYAEQFYQDGKKVVPKLIHRWITPQALAVWYMDDGSIKSSKHKSVFLNTHSFEDHELKRLQKALEDRYGIKTKIRKQKDGKQLYLLSETVDLFLREIEPYIIPSMQYKLPKVWLTQLPKM
jgi:hypothetical protein